MSKNRVFFLLNSLNKKEWKGLADYIKYPLVTKSKDTPALLDFLHDLYLKNLKSKDKLDYLAYAILNITNERIHNKLFPDEKKFVKESDDHKIRTLRGNLCKIIDNYFIFLKFQKDNASKNSFQKDRLLNQLYRERNMGEEFQKSAKNLLSQINKRPYKDADYFYDKYSLLQDLLFHVNTPREGKEIIDILKGALNNLYQFYSIERVRLGLDLKNRERIYKESHQFDLKKDTATISKDNILYILLEGVLNLFKIEGQSSAADDAFDKVQELFIDNIDLLNPEDSLNILLCLLNYAMQQANHKEDIYSLKIFALYKVGIEKKILFHNNQISGFTFINIVVVSTKLKEFDYAEKFIENNKLLLDKTIQESIEKLAWSYYHFSKGSYKKVAELLTTFSSSILLYMIPSRTLSLRNSYQLFEKNASYFNMLVNECAAFKKYLIRKEKLISFKKQEANINFTILLKVIIEQRNLLYQGKALTVDLVALFNKYPNIIARGWLKKIIDDLLSFENEM